MPAFIHPVFGVATSSAPFTITYTALNSIAAGDSVIVMAVAPSGTMTIGDTQGNMFDLIYDGPGAGPQGQNMRVWMVKHAVGGADVITISGGNTGTNLLGTTYASGVAFDCFPSFPEKPPILGVLTNYPNSTLNAAIIFTAAQGTNLFVTGYADAINTGQPHAFFSSFSAGQYGWGSTGAFPEAPGTYDAYFTSSGGSHIQDSWIFLIGMPLTPTAAGGAGFGAGIDSAGGDLLFF